MSKDLPNSHERGLQKRVELHDQTNQTNVICAAVAERIYHSVISVELLGDSNHYRGHHFSDLVILQMEKGSVMKIKCRAR